MAKSATTTVKAYIKVKKSRPGVHSKTKNSRMKGAKHYKKPETGLIMSMDNKSQKNVTVVKKMIKPGEL